MDVPVTIDKILGSTRLLLVLVLYLLYNYEYEYYVPVLSSSKIVVLRNTYSYCTSKYYVRTSDIVVLVLALPRNFFFCMHLLSL
jgi:hypothetical protein